MNFDFNCWTAILAAPGGLIQGHVDMSDETLSAGDWVRAGAGQVGKIVLISRLSAFVEVQQADTKQTATFLLSELEKIDPPPEPPAGGAQ